MEPVSIWRDLQLYNYFFPHYRYNLPIIFMIVNNNGIYSGLDEESWSELGIDPARGWAYQYAIKYSVNQLGTQTFQKKFQNVCYLNICFTLVFDFFCLLYILYPLYYCVWPSIKKIIVSVKYSCKLLKLTWLMWNELEHFTSTFFLHTTFNDQRCTVSQFIHGNDLCCYLKMLSEHSWFMFYSIKKVCEYLHVFCRHSVIGRSRNFGKTEH